jgi:hypothetical protein
VQFYRSDGIQEYAPNAPADSVAGHHEVVDGGTVTIEEHASPTATIYQTDGVTPTTVGGTARTSGGGTIAGGRITAYHPVTVDPMGDTFANPDGTWSMPIIPVRA